MKYTLFLQGEGLTADEKRPFITVHENRVVDVSVTCQKAGIQVGWSVDTAKAVLPDVAIHESDSRLAEMMEKVYQSLWQFSPFLQTRATDAFLQLPAPSPPFQEVRNLLMLLDGIFSPEQRIRVGLAENPFLAEALVAWSRLERVPQARYYRVKRQHLIVAPSLASGRSLESFDVTSHWIRQIPIQALWFIDERDKTRMAELGIHRLIELENVHEERLISQFGKRTHLWKSLFRQEVGGKLHVNYPPHERRLSWRAEMGEEMPIAQFVTLFHEMAEQLSSHLQKEGIGALTFCIACRTERGLQQFERVAKEPIFKLDQLLAQRAAVECQILGEKLEAMDLVAFDLQPLRVVQSSFFLYQNTFLPSIQREKTAFEEVREQLQHKFPSLKKGMSIHYREKRLQAIQQGAYV